MGDGEHRAPEAGHIVLQPLHRVQIQVVRRLVQQEDVRILQNQAAQIDPGLFAAGQSGEFPLAHLLRNAKAVAHLADAHVQIVAAGLLKTGGQTVIAAQKLLAALPAAMRSVMDLSSSSMAWMRSKAVSSTSSTVYSGG